MKQIDKNQVMYWLKVLALFIYAALTIATCAAVWNSGQGATLYVIAGILFCVNGYIIYRKATKLKIPTIENE